jgi:hypothetical protein
VTYKDVSDLIFIKDILKLDFVKKDINFTSDFNEFEYKSIVLKESNAFSFCSFWCGFNRRYWKLYKTYSFDSEDSCFEQLLIDFKFLEKRNILGTFEDD